MSTSDAEPSRTIVISLHESNGTSIGSFTMESTLTTSAIRAKLKLGDLTALLLLFSMIPSNSLRFESETSGASLPEQSTVTPLSAYRSTLSLNQLLAISSLFETSEKRLASLKRRLTQTGDSAPHITLPERRQVDFHLALTTLELVEIS